MKRYILIMIILLLGILIVIFKPKFYFATEQPEVYWNCMKECVNDANYPEGWGSPDDGSLTSNPVEQACQNQCEEYRIVE